MTLQNADAAAPDAGTTGQAAVPPAGQPDWQKEADTWKNRHGGLQGKYQQETGRLQAEIDKLMAQIDGLKPVSAERDTLSLKVGELTNTLTAAQTEAAKLRQSQERLKLIAKDYPQLLELEMSGALPDGTGDDFAAKLKLIAGKLQANAQEALENLQKGQTPPPPSGGDGGTKSSKAILAEAIALQREGKFAEYNARYSDYLKAKALEESKH